MIDFYLPYHKDKKSSNYIEIGITAIEGKYIKSLPLHHSQTIIEDDENSVTVKIKIHITHDFIMKLLSHGANVKVCSPVSLKEEIIKCYKKAMEQYD